MFPNLLPITLCPFPSQLDPLLDILDGDIATLTGLDPVAPPPPTQE